MSSASLDRLKRLDASGGLDDQQGVRREVIPGVESLLRFSQAAQRVLEDPAIPDGFPPDQAASLPSLRVAGLAGREGISDAVQAAARRLCALRAKDPDALLAQATACLECTRVIDQARGSRPFAGAIEETRRLCHGRARTAVAQALEKEPASLASLEHDLEFKILREDPTIRTLITLHTEKAKAQAEARK
jgi:hypothetical protein